ncbi:membrane protein [Orientia tsutsugamushi]|nr:membrane protein [Orientia tsutsugamushi]
MIKNTKQETIVKISLILSTLFFASTTQSILGMNILLDAKVSQNDQKAKLNYEKHALTSKIKFLEQQKSQLVGQQHLVRQAMQASHLIREGILNMSQLLQAAPSQQEMEQFQQGLLMPEVNSNNDDDITRCVESMDQRSQGLAKYERIMQNMCRDVDLICSQELLNLLMAHPDLHKAVQDINDLKQAMQDTVHNIDGLYLQMMQMIHVVQERPVMSVEDINEGIRHLNNAIQQVQHGIQLLNQELHGMDLLDEENLREFNQYFEQKLRELQEQIEHINQQICVLNQKITNADQKVNAINLQLDNLDGADATIPKASSQPAISFTDQQKALQKAAQNHDAAVTNAIIVNTETVVSTTTSGMSNMANSLPNIISSGSNICSSNNGWNVQGNIFTSKISKEENKELKKHDAGINGAFIIVNKYVNENTIIGATGLYSNLNIQYDENIKHILNKTDCKTFSLSLNARYYPQHNVFTQGIIGFITYDGKTEYVANQPSSEINGKGYYGDFMLGGHLNPVKHNLKLTLSPIVGIRYNKVNNSSHKLFDGTNVSDADHHMLEGRVGATIKYVIDNKNISIIPEVYAFIHSNLYTNSSDIKLEYTPSSDSGIVDIKEAKIHTLFGQLGGTVTIYRGQIGFGASYSAYFAEKYIAHVGSLNIKANF